MKLTETGKFYAAYSLVIITALIGILKYSWSIAISVILCVLYVIYDLKHDAESVEDEHETNSV